MECMFRIRCRNTVTQAQLNEVSVTCVMDDGGESKKIEVTGESEVSVLWYGHWMKHVHLRCASPE